MVSRLENDPRQESEIDAEKPRTGAVILTTRTYIGKLLNESLANKKLNVSEILANTRKTNSKIANVRYRYWLEYGKEDALRYALHQQSNLERELNLKENLTTDNHLENNSFVPVKNPEEIAQARVIVSRCVDIALSEARWHGIDTERRFINGDKGIKTTEQFVRAAGFYQSLSYLLGKENDGGMAEFIGQSDPKDFKLSPHP